MTNKDIIFREIRHLNGPNMWTYRPVLEAIVDIGDLEDCPSNTIPGYYERLKTLLPSLNEHRCSYDEPGGFLRRVQEGTWPAHILEHVTLELQNLAGLPGGFGRARETGERGVYKVVVRAWQEEITRTALEEARKLIMAAMEDRPFNVDEVITNLSGMVDSLCLGPSTTSIVNAADELGIPCIRLLENGNLVQLGYGAAMRRIWTAETDRTSAIAEGISRDKNLTRSLLQSCGVPVPEGCEVNSSEEAWETAQDIGLPVCIKPLGTHHNGSVFIDLNDREAIEMAYQTVADKGSGVLVERAIRGSRYRLLIIGGKMVAASHVDSIHRNPRYTSDVTDDVHPETSAIASLTARTVGLDIAGVDLVVKDISKPLTEQDGAIVGVNAGPDLLMHLRPNAGKPRPVGKAIVEHLFPEQISSRIPVVGITGSYGKTTVAQIITQLLILSGKHTGLACSKGLYLNRRQSEKGDCARWKHANRILMNRAIQAAVFENGSDAIVTEGLAYDRCQIGVITNIDTDQHTGQYHIETPEHVFSILRTQVDLVLKDGAAVLNAKEPALIEMAPLCDGEVIYFAHDPSLPVIAEHLKQGKRAVIVRHEEIMLLSGDEELSLAKLKDIPLTQNGENVPQIENVLAAIGAAWALNISPDVMCTGIETFFAEQE